MNLRERSTHRQENTPWKREVRAANASIPPWYCIVYSGNKHAHYETLDAARAVANEIADKTNIIVGIELHRHR